MLRALLIDDDADFLSGMAEVASQEGFAVTGRELACLRGPTERVYALAFSPDGQKLVSGAADVPALRGDEEGASRLCRAAGGWRISDVGHRPSGG